MEYVSESNFVTNDTFHFQQVIASAHRCQKQLGGCQSTEAGRSAVDHLLDFVRWAVLETPPITLCMCRRQVDTVLGADDVLGTAVIDMQTGDVHVTGQRLSVPGRCPALRDN